MSGERRAARPASDELRERFGSNLVRCRKRLGISQEQLWFRAEVHKTSLSDLERGLIIPRIGTVLRIAGALGVTPNDLVEGIAWKPPEINVTKGSFEVPPDPELAAEIAALRAAGRIGASRKRRG
ncbi:MAG TPA: helix-turn-helix transcriptional regulator [Solirubrobacterales bacterium]|nr:helix-turn-helix transcriptional regulator [Solirubrobacterales bacterium]